MSVLLSGRRRAPLQDFVLHLLAHEQPLPIANAFLQISDVRGANDVLIRLNGGVTAFQRAALPGEEPRARDAGLTFHERHAHSRLHRSFDETDLLGRRPPAPALHRCVSACKFDPLRWGVGVQL